MKLAGPGDFVRFYNHVFINRFDGIKRTSEIRAEVGQEGLTRYVSAGCLELFSEHLASL
jgi:hypothetical protein